MALALNAPLFSPGDRVLIGVSGGVDSLALLHLLVGERESLQIELIAVHVHHGMRGEVADADVEFLSRICEAWSVSFEVVYRDVPALVAERGVGIEEAGRLARYEAFAELARKCGCRKVATAHHADDQVETLLLNLLRGTGLDGLRGMPERRLLSSAPDAPELIRPLLSVWRHELEAYCRDHGLAPRHDVTNDDPRYRRNRIRQELVPLLDSLAPAARQNLLRLTQQAGEEVAVMECLARDLLAQARVRGTLPPVPGRVPGWLVRDRVRVRPMLDVAPLRTAPTATTRRALRFWLRESAGLQAEFSLQTIDRVIGLLQEDSQVNEIAIDLPDCGLRVRRKRGHILVEPQRVSVNAPAAASIPSPGVYPLVEHGLSLSLAVSPAPVDLRLPPDRACLDLTRIEWPLCLRTPRKGDRFHPLGAEGSRLQSDLFIDRKIPGEARDTWPVLEDAAGIVWVCGLAIADRVRVTPASTACLNLRIEPWKRADTVIEGA